MANLISRMEEEMHISSLDRLTAHTVIRPQTGKFCLCIAKGNEQLLNSKFHQVIPTERQHHQQQSLAYWQSILLLKLSKPGYVLSVPY